VFVAITSQSHNNTSNNHPRLERNDPVAFNALEAASKPIEIHAKTSEREEIRRENRSR